LRKPTEKGEDRNYFMKLNSNKKNKFEKNFFQNVEELNMIIANLNQELLEKEKIINELKLRIMDYQKEKSIQKISLASRREEVSQDDSFNNFNNYLNKSDDNILFANEDKISNASLQKKCAKYENDIKLLKDKL
jgi:hypothetical protein